MSAGSCNIVVFDKFTHAYKHPIALVIMFIPILIIYWEALSLNDVIVRKSQREKYFNKINNLSLSLFII